MVILPLPCIILNAKRITKNGRSLGTRLLHCGKVGGGIDPATVVNQYRLKVFFQ